MSEFVAYVLAGLFMGCILAVIFLAGMWVSATQCTNKWPGKNPSWAPMQGCMIDTDEGRIPASNYRVL